MNSSPLGAALVVPALTAFVGEARIRAALASIFAPAPVPEGYLEHVGAPLTLTRTALRANATMRADLLGEITALVPRYPELKIPMEIVHGDADTTVSVKIHGERMAKESDQVRLTVLPGAAHMPHHSHAADVVATIDRAAARAGLLR